MTRGSSRCVRAPELVVDEEALERALREQLPEAVRAWLPCPDRFARLRVASPTEDELRMGYAGYAAWMLSPWRVRDQAVTAPMLDRWVAHTARTRGEPKEAHADIARALADFLGRFDPTLRAQGHLRVEYDLGEVLAALARFGAR